MSYSISLYEQLDILNTIFTNTTDIYNNKQIKYNINHNSIKTKLYKHQENLVEGMIQYREKMTRGFVWRNHVINGKLGIIGDPPGTGKTLSILAYIASLENNKTVSVPELEECSNTYFYSFKNTNTYINDISSCNLIIVPSSLISQWKNEITTHTTMPYTIVDSKRIIRNNSTLESIKHSRLLITTPNCYKSIQVLAKKNNIHWDNVFIDEASQIYISSNEEQLQFNFLWLITNSWIPLLFKNISLSPADLLHISDRINIHPELESWLKSIQHNTLQFPYSIASSSFFKQYLPYNHPARGLMIIKNSQAAIENSIQLHDINNIYISCKSSISLYYLTNLKYSTDRIDKIINDIPSLFNSLSIQNKTMEQLVEEYPEKNKRIIHKCSDSCTICFDEPTNKTMLLCCNSVYCGKCITQQMINNMKCPTCRKEISLDTLCSLIEQSDIHYPIKNKLDTCISYIHTIINTNPSAKIVIYTTFHNICYQLKGYFDKTSISSSPININQNGFKTSMEQYKNSPINILFISNVDLLRGVSLENTTHLIFFHELPFYELKQVLVHSCQRIGRKEPLTILHLNSENEQ
jgi:DNA polymerase III delta prime subunit